LVKGRGKSGLTIIIRRWHHSDIIKDSGGNMKNVPYIEIVKQVLVPMFHKESQLGRSAKSNDDMAKLVFKKRLFDTILSLVEKVETGALTNIDVRSGIRRLAEEADVTAGQAQKVINVYLKYYCVLRDKQSLIKELDCPIDSGIVKHVWKQLTPEDKVDIENRLSLAQHDVKLNWIFFSEITRLNELDFLTYELLQKRLEEMGNGIRLLVDFEIYDKERIAKYLSKAEGDNL
jgi:hypothetical protein